MALSMSSSLQAPFFLFAILKNKTKLRREQSGTYFLFLKNDSLPNLFTLSNNIICMLQLKSYCITVFYLSQVYNCFVTHCRYRVYHAITFIIPKNIYEFSIYFYRQIHFVSTLFRQSLSCSLLM